MVPVAVRLTSDAGANQNPTGRGVCHYHGRDGEAHEQGGNHNGQSEDSLHETPTIVLNHRHMRHNGRNSTKVDDPPQAPAWPKGYVHGSGVWGT
jgi:hypothetical protein